jgi:hypothetical protein
LVEVEDTWKKRRRPQAVVPPSYEPEISKLKAVFTDPVTYQKALAPGETLDGSLHREAVAENRDADGLVPGVRHGTGRPCHILVVHPVRRETEGPRASGKAAVHEEGGPDWALERAERDSRRVCGHGQHTFCVQVSGAAHVPVGITRTNGEEAMMELVESSADTGGNDI